MKTLYTTSATATGGRDGRATTQDGSLDVMLAVPKDMGGDGGAGNNPEQLFAAGYSACFLGALKVVAGQEKQSVPDDATVTAEVGIGPRDDEQGFGLSVSLLVDLPGVDRGTAEDLMQKANVVCPYSHATKGNIDVALRLA